MATSMLARCVDKNVSLPFIGMLFKTRDQWISENALSELKNLSKQAGLNNEEFDKCLNNQTLLDELISIKDQAITDYNISSTPSFVINGNVITGNKPYKKPILATTSFFSVSSDLCAIKSIHPALSSPK